MDKLKLMKITNEVRKDIVTAVHSAKAGHPGGSLSAAEILTYLYFEEMDVIRRIRARLTETDLCCPKDIQLPRSTLFLQSGDISRKRIL